MMNKIIILVLLGVFIMMVPDGSAFAGENIHRSRFFVYEDYIARVTHDVVPQEKAALTIDPLAGVVPHHAPTTFPLIAEFYARLKATTSIDTFVVVGPDHYNAGKGMVMVSRQAFLTPAGRVDPDIGLIDRLVDKELAVVDERPYDKEHSMDTQLIFIKHYFPKAKVVQLVMNARITESRSKSIGNELAQNAPARTFVVASVDFSHYLTAAKARPIDRYSQKLMESADPAVVSRIVADSPGSLTTLLTFVKARGASALRPFRTYNTADFSNNNSNTTGYIAGYYGLKRTGGHKAVISSIARTENPAVHGSARLVAVGDIMLSRHIEKIMKQKKDWTFPFTRMKNFLSSADLAIANLESPFTFAKASAKKKGPLVFGADPKSVTGLTTAGIDIVSLANNHSLDQGWQGVLDTEKVISESGLAGVGAGATHERAHRPIVREVNGVRIAFLAYTDVPLQGTRSGKKNAAVAVANESEVAADIAHADPSVDLVVVSFHWGNEYKTRHSLRQERLAHIAIDAGADLILGHHPHVPQDIGSYKNVPIVYSMGNFVFDQNFSRDTRQGVAVEIFIKNKKISTVVPHDVRFTSAFQPYLQ